MTQLRYVLSFAVFLILHTCLCAQAPAEVLTSYIESEHFEKVYVSLNKPYYLPDETIYGSIFLVDGHDHQPLLGQVVVTIELRAPSGDTQLAVVTKVSDGHGSFSMYLDEVVKEGEYTLTAYTDHMNASTEADVFQRKLHVVRDLDGNTDDEAAADKLEVRFFPEGGYSVEGINCKIAFSVSKGGVIGENITGRIVDSRDSIITDVNTSKNGIGIFHINASKNEKYRLVIPAHHGELSFDLPESLQEGYTLSVNNLKEKQLFIEVVATEKYVERDWELVGHIRGEVFLSKSGSTKKSLLSIDKKDLPSGVLHFTLFDDQSRPVAERLVYHTNLQEEIGVKMDKSFLYFNHSDMASLDIGLDSDDEVSGRASLTIFSNEVRRDLNDQINIKNYLLLQSDLRGAIPNLGDYTILETADQRYLMDLLMLTNGWRRFKWVALMSDESTYEPAMPQELSTIAGNIKSIGKTSCEEVTIRLSAISEDIFQSYETVTDEMCQFEFHAVDLTDTTTIHLSAAIMHPTQDKEIKTFEFMVAPSAPLDFDPNHTLSTYSNSSFRLESTDVATDNMERLTTESAWSLQLENVTVKSSINNAQKLTMETKRRYEKRGLYHISSSQKFDPTLPELEKYRKHTVFEMIQHVATNVKVITKLGRKTLIYGKFSAQFEPPIYLDGIRVSSEQLEAVDPESIAVIDIPTGLVAQMIWDSAAAIVLLSKDPSEYVVEKPGTFIYEAPGYHTAREYFDEHPLDVASGLPDLRTCLYWNPNINLTTTTSKVDFKTSELVGEHIARVEGITVSGIPFFREIVFEVR